MILIGQYDSPFVRRVAIALMLYELPFDQEPWSVWADADKIAPYNPLRRVPALRLDTGDCLIESFAILDALDEQVGPARALLPPTGPVRREGLRICALATGAAEKAVSLFYERAVRDVQSPLWSTRCTSQISETLTMLERERATRSTEYWLGDTLSHADIAVACALRFISEAHPEVYASLTLPLVARDASHCERMPVFRRIVQPLTLTTG